MPETATDERSLRRLIETGRPAPSVAGRTNEPRSSLANKQHASDPYCVDPDDPGLTEAGAWESKLATEKLAKLLMKHHADRYNGVRNTP